MDIDKSKVIDLEEINKDKVEEIRENETGNQIEKQNHKPGFNPDAIDENGKFKKGVCPYRGGGRPPMPEEFKQLANEYSIPALKVAVDIMMNPKERSHNRLKAVELIWDRVWGKPSVQIDANVSSKDNEPITIEHIVRLLNPEKKEGE